MDRSDGAIMQHRDAEWALVPGHQQAGLVVQAQPVSKIMMQHHKCNVLLQPLPKSIPITEGQERAILNEMIVDLSEHLDFKTTYLYLLKHNFLNSNQQQQLMMDGQTKSDRAQKLLEIMMTNSSTPATKLLGVLKDMQQGEASISPAHEELISTLTTKIAQFNNPPNVGEGKLLLLHYLASKLNCVLLYSCQS